MQSRTVVPNMGGKYRVVPRTKEPIAEGEIRVSMMGRMPRYVSYACRLLSEPDKKTITIKATGNAIPGAITLAEVVKRRFENIHQQSVIGISRTVDTFEPIEHGLDQVVHERDVPYIEIMLSKELDLVDAASAGYQLPIDQSLVRPRAETQESRRPRERETRQGGRGRGVYRARGRGFIRSSAYAVTETPTPVPASRGRASRGFRGSRGRGYQGGSARDRGSRRGGTNMTARTLYETKPVAQA